MELVRKTVAEIRGEVPPVAVAEGGGQLEDARVILLFEVAAEVGAAVTEAAGDGALPGGELEEEPLALVLAAGVPLDFGEQLVRHHHPGDAAGVEVARRRPAEDVDVGEHRNVQSLERHVLEQLVHLAGVVADLVDDEGGPGGELGGELEVLRHDLALVALVVVDDGPEEEVGPFHARPAAPGSPRFQSLVHVREHLEEADRVDVEDAAGAAAVAVGRVVAGQGEDALEPLAGQLPGVALQAVPVPVLAGEVDDDVLPPATAGRSRGCRR